jgi:hypothetical protein
MTESDPRSLNPDISLLRHLPNIKRARGFRLYDGAGKRYLDLYQNGGRAILGHRPPGVSTRIKNVISTGLYAELPSVWGGRLLRALERVFPHRPGIRIFRDGWSASAAARQVAARQVADKGAGQSSERVQVLRPFGPNEDPQSIALPVLPFPGGFGPQPVLFPNDCTNLPDSDIVSPVPAVALLQCVSALQRDPRWSGGFTGCAHTAGGRAGCADWSGLRNGVIWQIEGWYLRPRLGREKYSRLFLFFLEHGFLVSPDPEVPSILPAEASTGEIAAFCRCCERAEEEIYAG